MSKLNLYTIKNIKILIFVCFLMSIILSFFYISKFDKISVNNSNIKEHSMIKIAIDNSWNEADKIIKDYKNGKNFFLSGGTYDEYLPGKIIAIYYLLINDEIYSEKGVYKTQNGKFGLLFIKTLIYFLSLLYLSKKLNNIFEKKNLFLIILFLSIEPTIFQYHSSFWNESISFSLQILLFGMLITRKNKNFLSFKIGIIVGLIYLIGSEYLLYIIPVTIYFFLFYKKNLIKNYIFLISGLLIILNLVAYNNYKKIKTYSFTTHGSQTALYIYYAPQIISEVKKINSEDSKALLKDQRKNWAIKNEIEINFGGRIIDEVNDVDKKKYSEYLQNKVLKIVLDNPLAAIKIHFKKSIHSLVLDPFYQYNFHKFDAKGTKQYYGSDTQKQNVPLRIIYSLILYLIMIRGFFNLLKLKKFDLIILILLLAFYQISTLGWMGNNRYLVPALIYLSIFFSFGIFPQKNKNY